MGFKCPFCLKDFKQDKKSWELHCKKEHNGLASNVISLVKKITKNDK